MSLSGQYMIKLYTKDEFESLDTDHKNFYFEDSSRYPVLPLSNKLVYEDALLQTQLHHRQFDGAVIKMGDPNLFTVKMYRLQDDLTVTCTELYLRLYNRF